MARDPGIVGRMPEEQRPVPAPLRIRGTRSWEQVTLIDMTNLDE